MFSLRRPAFGAYSSEPIIHRTEPGDSLHRTCYVATPLYVCGFVLLGAAFQKHLSVGALVMGWGIAEVAVMVNTVAICTCSRSRLP